MDERPIRVQGDPEVMDEIAALIRAADDARYLRTETDDSGGIGADFELVTVATVIAMVSTLFFDGPIIPKLYGVLRRHRGTRITIEHSTGSVSIEVKGDFSEESLKAVLGELAKA